MDTQKADPSASQPAFYPSIASSFSPIIPPTHLQTLPLDNPLKMPPNHPKTVWLIWPDQAAML